MTNSEQELFDFIGVLLRGDEVPAHLQTCSPELASHFRQHHLLPLAHHAGMGGLSKEYLQFAMINEVHLRTMEDIGANFLEQGLPWTVIKGAAYAWKIYEDSALRPMSDIDVLVKDEDFDRAGQCLVDMGYLERSVAARTRHAQTYSRAGHELVDLHRSILQPMRSNSDMSRLWSRAKPSDFLPGYFELDPIDLTCVHIAHMARHEFSVPLVSYVDLQRLLKHLSPIEIRCLDDELVRWRMDFAYQVIQEIRAELVGEGRRSRSARMRVLMPTKGEIITCAHRSRRAQVARKLALFPQDSLALGVGWALRTAEDKLIALRK